MPAPARRAASRARTPKTPRSIIATVLTTLHAALTAAARAAAPVTRSVTAALRAMAVVVAPALRPMARSVTAALGTLQSRAARLTGSLSLRRKAVAAAAAVIAIAVAAIAAAGAAGAASPASPASADAKPQGGQVPTAAATGTGSASQHHATATGPASQHHSAATGSASQQHAAATGSASQHPAADRSHAAAAAGDQVPAARHTAAAAHHAAPAASHAASVASPAAPVAGQAVPAAAAARHHRHHHRQAPALNNWQAITETAAGHPAGGPLTPAQQLLPAPLSGTQSYLPLTPDRAANAAIITSQALHLHMGIRSAVIAVATAMQESTLENLSYGDRDSLGLFQQRPSMGWGTPAQILDPVYAADAFLNALRTYQNNNPAWATQPLWEAAQGVQNSGFPYAYAQWENQAAQIVANAARHLL